MWKDIKQSRSKKLHWLFLVDDVETKTTAKYCYDSWKCEIVLVVSKVSISWNVFHCFPQIKLVQLSFSIEVLQQVFFSFTDFSEFPPNASRPIYVTTCDWYIPQHTSISYHETKQTKFDIPTHCRKMEKFHSLKYLPVISFLLSPADFNLAWSSRTSLSLSVSHFELCKPNSPLIKFAGKKLDKSLISVSRLPVQHETSRGLAMWVGPNFTSVRID